MFGYIIVNKPEMKIKDFDTYHSYYCGLCRKLKGKYGLAGQSTLSYDMTFLHLLLTSLYEPEVTTGRYRCIVHPFIKHPATISEYTEYVADMNIVLSYYKCKDDWVDEKKYLKLAYSKLLGVKYNRIEQSYSDKLQRIHALLNEINQKEQSGVQDIDIMAGCFGNVMAEIFTYRRDEWEQNMRKIGFYLGKFIYLMDAYEDIEDDLANGNYNPFRNMYGMDGFDEQCYTILTMMITECAKEFEKLPILQNIEILRNIIYSGVWCRYEAVIKKRKETQVISNE